MKRILFLAVIFVAVNFSYASGAGAPPPPTPCDKSGSRLNEKQIVTAVEDKLICAKNAKSRWSEEHIKGGKLYEYARGPADKVDPRREAGTWTVMGSGNSAVIRYNYGTGGIYDRGLWSEDSKNYSFCDGSTVVATATIMSIPGSGANPCP